MKCSYHPASDSQELCSTCNKPLCVACSHKIKGKVYCQDCLVRGAEWVSAVKDLRIPADSPKRAACCALIPGMGAVYNGEYLKAITFFAVFAALSLMGDRIHGIFGFGAFAFLIFTMFDAYRMAEARARVRLEARVAGEQVSQDRAVVGWGIFLVILGIVFLLQNIIPFDFVYRLWPLVFIFVGGYLVYRAFFDKDKQGVPSGSSVSEKPLALDNIGPTEKKDL
jgi:LiaI-LiaF-like transmembrane region